MVEEGGSISSRPAWNLLNPSSSEKKNPGISVSKLAYGVTLTAGEDRELGAHLLLAASLLRPSPTYPENMLTGQLPSPIVQYLEDLSLKGTPPPTRRATKGSTGEITTHVKIFVLLAIFGAEELYFIS